MKQLTLFEEEEIIGVDESAPEEIQNAWRKAKQDMKRNFRNCEALAFDDKKIYFFDTETYLKTHKMSGIAVDIDTLVK